MDKTTIDALFGVIRHAMTTAGGGLVAAGVVTNEQWTALVGGVVAILGIGWSIWQKKKAK